MNCCEKKYGLNGGARYNCVFLKSNQSHQCDHFYSLEKKGECLHMVRNENYARRCTNGKCIKEADSDESIMIKLEDL